MPLSKVKKLLKLINKINALAGQNSTAEQTSSSPGRTRTYDDFCIFKIYVLMTILNIKNIKAILELLAQEKDLRKLCGLEDNLDRTTLNRRLNSLYKKTT